MIPFLNILFILIIIEFSFITFVLLLFSTGRASGTSIGFSFSNKFGVYVYIIFCLILSCIFCYLVSYLSDGIRPNGQCFFIVLIVLFLFSSRDLVP